MDLDQPIKRQLDLITALLPQARSIGLLYTTQPKELNALRMLASTRKLLVNERAVDAGTGIHAALQELLLSSDALLAWPDAEIYNASTIRNILLATYRNKVPLLGFSGAYVKAGAVGAVFSTPQQIAAQSASIVQAYRESHSLPAMQYAKEFEVSVNEQVARSLGLTIKSAAQLRAEMELIP